MLPKLTIINPLHVILNELINVLDFLTLIFDIVSIQLILIDIIQLKKVLWGPPYFLRVERSPET